MLVQYDVSNAILWDFITKLWFTNNVTHNKYRKWCTYDFEICDLSCNEGCHPQNALLLWFRWFSLVDYDNDPTSLSSWRPNQFPSRMDSSWISDGNTIFVVPFKGHRLFMTEREEFSSTVTWKCFLGMTWAIDVHVLVVQVQVMVVLPTG